MGCGTSVEAGERKARSFRVDSKRASSASRLANAEPVLGYSPSTSPRTSCTVPHGDNSEPSPTSVTNERSGDDLLAAPRTSALSQSPQGPSPAASNTTLKSALAQKAKSPRPHPPKDFLLPSEPAHEERHHRQLRSQLFILSVAKVPGTQFAWEYDPAASMSYSEEMDEALYHGDATTSRSPLSLQRLILDDAEDSLRQPQPLSLPGRVVQLAPGHGIIEMYPGEEQGRSCDRLPQAAPVLTTDSKAPTTSASKPPSPSRSRASARVSQN